MPTDQQQPSPGRIVHYALPANGPHGQEVRPAMIVRPWQPIEDGNAHSGMSNLKVFLDGSNDVGLSEWVGSVLYDENGAPGTWRWPPRV